MDCMKPKFLSLHFQVSATSLFFIAQQVPSKIAGLPHEYDKYLVLFLVGFLLLLPFIPLHSHSNCISLLPIPPLTTQSHPSSVSSTYLVIYPMPHSFNFRQNYLTIKKRKNTMAWKPGSGLTVYQLYQPKSFSFSRFPLSYQWNNGMT